MVSTMRSILVVFAAFLLSGCAAASRESPPVEDGPLRSGVDAFVLSEHVPWSAGDGAGPSAIEGEIGPGVFETLYVIVEGPKAGKLMRVTRRAGADSRSWILTRRIEGEGGPQEERFQAIDPADGSLVLASMKNHERGVIVETSPAALTAPARIDPAATITREMTMKLPRLDQPTRLREKGTARSELTYAGDQLIATPGGAFEARLLREVFVSDLTNAIAKRTIERWFAEGVGLVAERWEEEVRVFGVVIERSVQGIRVIGPGKRESVALGAG